MPEEQKTTAEARAETPEERAARKKAELEATLRKARAQHQAWLDSGREFTAFDTYARFRQEPTPEEQEMLDGYQADQDEIEKDPPARDKIWEKGFIDGDGRLALWPKLAGNMRLALDRAGEQLDFCPYPEQPGLLEKYPGVDPRGKCTETEMSLAARLESVKAALAVRPPEVRDFVQSVLDDMSKPATSFGRVMSSLPDKGMEIRTMTRAAKVALDRATSEHLEEEAFNRESSCQEMQWADRTIQTLEYLTGLSDKPITGEQRQEMAQFGREIPEAAEALRDAPNVRPAGLTVDFPNFDHEMQYRFISNPHNWGKSLRQMPPDATKVEPVARAVSSYAAATANRTLDGCFRQIEALTGAVGSPDAPMMNRGDLVTVDGMTIREHMEREYLAEHRTLEDFGNFYDANYRQRAGEILSAGLMAGKRVEAFVPDKMGRIGEPVQITKTGYEPSPLKKVTLNAWERHFAKHGFYKKKLARAEEYRRVMESRERVKTINDKQRGDLQGSTSSFLKNQIFGGAAACREAMRGVNTQYSWSRGFPVLLAVSSMIAQGHAFEDIVNPDKLQAEKLAAGQEVIRRTREDDHAWIGGTMHDGYRTLLEEVDQRFSRFNVADPSQMQEHYPEVAGRCEVLFDLFQEATRPGALEGFLARAEEAAPGTSTQVEFEMEERIRAVGHLALGMGHMLNGKLYYSDANRVQQAELGDPEMNVGDSCMTNYITGMAITRRFAQAMQGGAPASRAVGGTDALRLNGSAGASPGLTTIMDPMRGIQDNAYRGQVYQAVQHLAAHDKLDQALPVSLGRRDCSQAVDAFSLGEDGKAVRTPRMMEVGEYRLRVDQKKFIQTLQQGAKKLEDARKLASREKDNQPELAEKEAVEKETPAKAKPAAKQARPAGRTK